MCPQVEAVAPSAQFDALTSALDASLREDEVKSWAIESLAAAVRIPSISYDGMDPPGQDPRFEIFASFHDYLAERFPLVHGALEQTKINTYALLYHWQGSDSSLKPLILTAHQDVTPVLEDTLDQWIHPPFSGHFDGTWIWGRGSCDDKSGLISILSAIELMLEKGYKPTRTVVLSFGIDEESSGPYGAGALADYIVDVYGKNSFAFLVDEGGAYANHDGAVIASPGVAEKGYINVQIEITNLGGHSSVPTPHTGIGLMAAMVKALEDNPFPTALLRHKTYFANLQCSAAHDPSLAPERAQLIANASVDDAALSELHKTLLSEGGNLYRAITGTTQAIDIIQAGVKVNALPERTYVAINHRVADYSDYDTVKTRYATVLAPVADKYNLTLDVFGTTYGSGPAFGHLKIATAFDEPVPPAPDAPTYGSTPWALLAGTIRSTLLDGHRPDLPKATSAAVSPMVGLGTTDTKYYSLLTDYIYRYHHLDAGDSYNGAHTVNEAMKAEGFIEMIRFYTRLLLNVDEADMA
ncbi:carboxypeptidase S [Peniophora sp. CONT]|nr:carboxypeptidase S [Peniophora sp. CONT]